MYKQRYPVIKKGSYGSQSYGSQLGRCSGPALVLVLVIGYDWLISASSPGLHVAKRITQACMIHYESVMRDARAILRSCGATIVVVERRALRRNRARGLCEELFLDRLGARAVRHSPPRARSRKRVERPLHAARSRASSIVGCAVMASTRPAVGTISDSVKGGGGSKLHCPCWIEPKCKKYRL